MHTLYGVHVTPYFLQCVYMTNAQCSGRELTLLDCSYSRDLSNNNHSNDLGIRCGKGRLHNIVMLVYMMVGWLQSHVMMGT